MRRLVLPILIVFVAACQTTRYEGNEDSPYYLVPVGSVLTLNQDIEIPPHRVAVFLQDGQLKPLSQINQYYPHCKFEVLKIRDIPQTVHADRFTIEKAVQEITDSVDAGGIQLAGIPLAIGVGIGNGDGIGAQTFATRLSLRSASQPDVYLLSCGQWAFPSDGQHVSIRDIRRVLGKIFALQLAPTKISHSSGQTPAAGRVDEALYQLITTDR
jgi:hypothetical protein